MFKRKEIETPNAPVSRYTLPLGEGDQTIVTELCGFCSNQKDLTGTIQCEHYDLYIDNYCPHFIKYPDQDQRLDQLFLMRGKGKKESENA